MASRDGRFRGSRGGRGARGGGGRGRGGRAPGEIQVFRYEIYDFGGLYLTTVWPNRHPSTPLIGPDSRILQIENKYEKSASDISGIANLKLTADFPSRPGYGTQGKKILVYANYFQLLPAPNLNLTRYNVEVSPSAAGKKLKRIFQLLLEMPDFSGLATEFKSLLIARQRLDIPDGYTVEIKYREEGQDEPLERATNYQVRIVTPTTLAVSDLVSHLSSANVDSFAQKAEVIQGLNVLLGHHPQSNAGVSIGQNRYFSIDRSPGNMINIQDLDGGLESLRGYFQSVRPATGGILLNVNVSHGVFLVPIRLSLLYPRLGTGNKITLQKKLKGVCVEVTHLPIKKSKSTNQIIRRTKIIFGLAHHQDGQGGLHPPVVNSFGAGPKDVKFWLEDLSPASYISVFDYFRKSKIE